MRYDDEGRELPDQTPVEMPVGFRRPQPLAELVKALVRTELSREAAASGQETFDEANDFSVDDDEFPVSPHELLDDEEFRAAEQLVLDKAGADMENERAAISQHKVEVKDGGRKESAGADGGGVEDGVSGVGADGKVGAASSGKGRSAGDGGR